MNQLTKLLNGWAANRRGAAGQEPYRSASAAVADMPQISDEMHRWLQAGEVAPLHARFETEMGRIYAELAARRERLGCEANLS